MAYITTEYRTAEKGLFKGRKQNHKKHSNTWIKRSITVMGSPGVYSRSAGTPTFRNMTKFTITWPRVV